MKDKKLLEFTNSNNFLQLSPKDSMGTNLNLERISNVLDLINNPCKEIPAIQVVGTNGKGSIARFLESCLIEAGINVGATTSPHLVNWNERIRVNGKNISNNEFTNHILKVQNLSQDLSEFELVITCALDYFSIKNVELIILEAGLGGRLDATTSHPKRPLIAIGSIGLDHCEYLGDNIVAITNEKAAVITTGSTVISSNQNEKVSRILEEIAFKKKAVLKWVKPLPKSWELGIPGEVQRKNAAVAKGIIQELKNLGWELNTSQIKNGLKNAKWPARLQRIYWKGKPLLLDGAHNPHAASELAKERLLWKENEKGVHWILGIQSHKKGPEIIRLLVKKNDHAWIIPVPNQNSWLASELSKSCPDLSNQLHQISNVEEILERFIKRGEWPKPFPIIAGSLFLFENFMSNEFD